MKTLHTLFILLAALWISTAAAQDTADSGTGAKPTAHLETAIPHGIALLEAKDFKAFIEAFMQPELLEKIAKDEGGMDAFAKKFGASNKPDRLLTVFKAIKDTKPELSENGTRATYKIPGGVEGKGEITFAKVDESWRIMGN